jgi:hypothetical protein
MSQPWTSAARARRSGAALVVAAMALSACGGPGAPPALLDAAAQHTAAEKIASAFAGACLAMDDATGASGVLATKGWPRFGVVWDQPDSIFFAAKPSSASPAGLFVIGDRSQPAARRLTCVGHYPAEGIGPMVEAIERRWGPSRPGPASLPGSRVWSFRMKPGADLVSDSAALPSVATAPAAGERLVYVQVSHNPQLRDVASLVTVWRPAK